LIIDFHTHTFPETIAAYALKKLTDLGKIKPFGLATEKDLSEKMLDAGIDKSVILNIATKVEQVEVINRYCINKENDSLIFFGAMHQDYANYSEEVNFLYKNGIKGIKMHPEFQGFFPSDKKLYPLYKALSDNAMIIVFHSGKEEFFEKDEYFSHPKHFAAIHEDFPDLKMVLAHFGAHGMFEEAKELIFGKKIFVDISFDLTKNNISLLNQLLQFHSEDYILYGSDWPWRDLKEYFHLVESADISKTVLSKILGDNARKLLALKV